MPCGSSKARAGSLYDRESRKRFDDLVVPASAYAEALVGPYRHGSDAAGTVDAFLDAVAARVEPISRSIARRAAMLRAEHTTLRLPDALVIATALVLESDVLLSTDRHWPKFDIAATID